MDLARVVERHSRLHKIRAPRRSAAHPNPSPREATPSQDPTRAPRQRPNRGPIRHPNPIRRRANRRRQGKAPGWLRSARLWQRSQAGFCVTWRSPQSGCFLVSALEQETTCSRAIILLRGAAVALDCGPISRCQRPILRCIALHTKSLPGDLHDAFEDRFRVVDRTFARHCDRIGGTHCDSSVQRGTEKLQQPLQSCL